MSSGAAPRSALVDRRFAHEPGFRWRGGEVSRLEGFSDAIFGFALTLLVVSLEVPRTVEDLFEILRGFAGFAICFTLLFSVWFSHYRFFRRYGLNDDRTLILNAVLLFVVLFFVYPLKFVFTYLTSALMAWSGVLGQEQSEAVKREVEKAVPSFGQATTLMVVYGIGFLAVALVFALLYAHAWSRRAELELDRNETHLTVESIQGHLIDAGIAVLSIAIAFLGHPPIAGWTYGLLGPAHGLHGWRMRKARERIGAGA